MAYVKKLFDDNFLYYASYVIKDRAIPDLEDGLKPVQRRILHTLFEADDGKYHKVANIVGSCMKYHPHGDASIYSALVVLANKSLFIDRQGNFGNILTGDEASAARYIECRAAPLAKEVFHNPKTTEFADSYDGRNQEPVLFPAKLPVILMIGAEGIAVGMSTRILPHNPLEVIAAEIAVLRNRRFSLVPDFPTAGIVDASEYEDGMGKVRVRARLDVSDPKRIVVRELPYGTTTESLIESVEAAARAGRVKIASISDFTTEQVEIEIRLQRGVRSEEVLDALYAFTECEVSISCNLLLIAEGVPVLMPASDIVRHHAKRLVAILEQELRIEERELKDEIHARTLERIFIEERVYKSIENKKTQEGVQKAVLDGLGAFAKEIRREVTAEDVERLLKIPIRRISLYDIERAKAEMARIAARLKEVRGHLAKTVDYAIAWLQGVAKKLEKDWKRRTEVASFVRVDAREAAKRDLAIRYDAQTGYLGSSVPSGDSLFAISTFDKVLVIRRTGFWSVVPAPERLFVDQGLLHAAIADKEALAELVFTLVYKDGATGFASIKRFRIEGWIMNKDYPLVPEGSQVLWFSAARAASFTLLYTRKSKTRVREEKFRIQDFEPKGIKAGGVRLAAREVTGIEGEEWKIAQSAELQAELFGSLAPSGKAEPAGAKKGRGGQKPAGGKKPGLEAATAAPRKAGLLARAGEKRSPSSSGAKAGSGKAGGGSARATKSPKVPVGKAPAKPASKAKGPSKPRKK